VIHHGRARRCTLAQAQVAISITVIGTAQGGCLMASSGLSLLRYPRR
jgi:hypothetical protein